MSESNDKKFYWIKLRTDFFQADSPIDFLMSQENGCQYVVLYQMLCLKTANSNGILSSRIGEMIVPYDVKKIARDTKYFDVDTIMVALELFKQLGLIYEQQDGCLKISNYQRMVGCESATDAAIRKRNQRLRDKEKKEHLLEVDDCDKMSQEERDISVTKCHEWIEDKGSETECKDTLIDEDVGFIPDNEPKQKYVFQDCVDMWNTLSELGIPRVNRLPADSPRVPLLRKRLREYGEDSFHSIIQEIRQSDFLQGHTQSRDGKVFCVDFDWVIRPRNYPKILEGKYRNKDAPVRASDNSIGQLKRELQ